MPGDCPASLRPTAVRLCGKHSAPSRTPFRWTTRTVRLPTGIGVRLQTGMLFGFITECCSASDRNRVRLRPDSPVRGGLGELSLSIDRQKQFDAGRFCYPRPSRVLEKLRALLHYIDVS